MKNFTTLSLIVLAGFYLFSLVALPKGIYFLDLVQLIVFSIVIFPFYVKRFIKSIEKGSSLNFGLIFFIVMLIILILGNFNYYIVKYIYPLYTDTIENTNLYWMIGMILFAEGFLSFNPNIKYNNLDKVYIVSPFFIYMVFFIGVLGSLFLYLDIGYVPILQGTRNFEIKSGGSLFGRMWSFNAFCSLMAFAYFFQTKKSSYIIITILSIMQTLFLNQRMMLFASLVGIFLILWGLINRKKMLIIYMLFGVIAYMIVNTLFLGNRDAKLLLGSNIYKAYDLTRFQSETLFTTFNEYVQLNELFESNFNDFQYGRTLLNIPVAFIPAPFLKLFYIDKYEIQNNNSAKIYARFQQSKISDGIRTGILGEFFVNFSYLGVVFMFFVGNLVKLLHLFHRNLLINDFRYSLIIMLLVFLLYSLTGQIDGVASLTIQYLIFGFIMIKSWRFFKLPVLYKSNIK